MQSNPLSNLVRLVFCATASAVISWSASAATNVTITGMTDICGRTLAEALCASYGGTVSGNECITANGLGGTVSFNLDHPDVCNMIMGNGITRNCGLVVPLIEGDVNPICNEIYAGALCTAQGGDIGQNSQGDRYCQFGNGTQIYLLGSTACQAIQTNGALYKCSETAPAPME